MAEKNKKTEKEIKKVDKKEEKKDKKSSKAVEKRKKDEKQEIVFDSPSERVVHQILPFVFIVVAILLETCFILASITGQEHVGVAGEFLKNAFLGLFGFCAFVIPVMLVNLALNWRRFVDSGVIGSKVVFTILFLIALSGTIHVFLKPSMNPDTNAFILPLELFEYSYSNVGSAGVIGGFICECIYALFKSVGTTIIMIATTILFFIFSLGMTPRDMAIYIKNRTKPMRDKQKERQAELAEERKEKRRLEKERKAEEKRLREEEKARLAAEEEAKREAERLAEEERIAEAERRAVEIEEKEKGGKDIHGDIMIVNPETGEVEYNEPTQKKIDFNSEPEDRIGLDTIFVNPPKEYDKNSYPDDVELPEEKPAPKKKAAKAEGEAEGLSVELKEMTDIDTVPDDGEEGSIVPESIIREYVRPTMDLLKDYRNDESEAAVQQELMTNARALMDTLKSFGVRISEITYSRGPTITRYELKPDVGVRIRAIANLVDDIALSLATTGVRIEAPIPNKAAVGIEVPNKIAATVGFRSLIDTPEFTEKKSVLTAALGKDVGGNTIYFDIGKMPHMLIAGTTGSGKSVCINCVIMSILYKASPRDVKLILIDPKKVEFQPYRSIPHLYAPIVTDPKKAAGTLATAVAEMERRFELIESVGAKNISGYNELTKDDPSKEYLPYIVIIIDELADLMMTAADDVETAICRIAQKARAAGIHLIVGTQRPSVDVVTGLIKANIPSRIAFTVASQVDSKTILDTAGAEKLIGRGDMLFAPIGSTKPMRVQGAFIDDREVERIVDFINDNNDGVNFNDDFLRRLEEETAKIGNPKGRPAAGGADDDEGGEEGVDPKFNAALDVAIEMGKISTSLLQRRLEIGYGRAAKIIDRMERLGYVTPPDGNKPRQILVTKADVMEKRINDNPDGQ